MEGKVGPLLSAWVILLLHPLCLVSGNGEGDALHSPRSNLNDPNNVLQSWDPTVVNPCTWFHVTCSNDNNVIRVDLGNAALSCQLVPQLGLLKNLQYLELYSNNISGPIPSDLGNLSNLVSLDLCLNSFNCPIPGSSGKMSKLRFPCDNEPEARMLTKVCLGRCCRKACFPVLGVKGLIKEKKLEMLVDPDLQTNYVEDEVEQLIQVALLCTQGSPMDRPKMSEVVRMLERDGLAERWDEWQKVEVLRLDVEPTAHPTSDWIFDSTENLHAVELSGPS